MHGILQGNGKGAGPCTWVMLSSPILDMLSEQGHRVRLSIFPMVKQPEYSLLRLSMIHNTDLLQHLKGLIHYNALGIIVCKKCDVNCDLNVIKNIFINRLHNWKLADKILCPDSIKLFWMMMLLERLPEKNHTRRHYVFGSNV